MSGFVRFLHEVFQDFGSISSRKMFGGYGIYHEGVMICLVADDTLYLKADKTTEKHFIEKELTSFEYDKGNKKVQMSSHRARGNL